MLLNWVRGVRGPALSESLGENNPRVKKITFGGFFSDCFSKSCEHSGLLVKTLKYWAQGCLGVLLTHPFAEINAPEQHFG